MSAVNVTTKDVGNLAKGTSLAQDGAWDDTWVYSYCEKCYCHCGIKVHRVNGVVVKIEGDPDCPHNWGKMCAKGQAAMMSLYHPRRLKNPVKRTNPDKGIGVDPQWVEISWEEGLKLLEDKLRAVREKDPRRLLISSFDLATVMYQLTPWASAFGTPIPFWVSAAAHCGASLHMSTYLLNGTFHSDMDLDYCEYLMLVGNQHGFMSGLTPEPAATKMAEARMRGMKLVVVDPRCGVAAAKADEWISIRPGTDGAFALAMLNVLLNELGIYDVEFIKKHTNGVYLVGLEGYYVRDKDSGKPLVWDTQEGKAKPFDGPVVETTLLGTYEVAGIPCRPAFQVLKEHVGKWSPERASHITTVPAETIRRIAKEFGEAARIGSTIVIEGMELPFRPVALNAYIGAQAHKHGTETAILLELINLVVGSMYAVGGHRGQNVLGPFWEPVVGVDGLIRAHPILHAGKDTYDFLEYEACSPEDLDFKELFPVAALPASNLVLALLEPKKFKTPYMPEVLLQCRCNLMATMAEPAKVAEALKKIPFVVSFSLLLDETAELSDLVFPDLDGLERLDLFPNNLCASMSPETGYFYWGLRQPVVEPPPGVKHWDEILLELADKLGFLPEYLELLNSILFLNEPYKLDPTKKYTREEILDIRAKSMLGPEQDLAWLKQHGTYAFKRSIRERYPQPFIKPRYPIYLENFKKAGDYLREVVSGMGISWDTSDYQPLMEWKPCPSYGEDPPYDLYFINYHLPFHTFSHTMTNPWLFELGEHHPSAYKVSINAETAMKKGIRDGDWIWLETGAGLKARGQAHVTERIHPEVVAAGGCFGRWASRILIGEGKGVHCNSMMGITMDNIDLMSAGQDRCVRVKIYK